jgi:nucleoid-associated protein EbfC
MNQMQQMLMQAQKLQREMEKAHEELAKKEFHVAKAGMVEITVLGNKTIKAISIDKEALAPENKELLETTIKMALDEAFAQVNAESEAIDERITGRKGVFPY